MEALRGTQWTDAERQEAAATVRELMDKGFPYPAAAYYARRAANIRRLEAIR